MYYLRSDNKGADQLYGQHAADLRLCFRICIKRFSHDVAHLLVLISMVYRQGQKFIFSVTLILFYVGR